MKTTKAIIIVVLGLIVWILFLYLAIAFIKAEINPFIWSEAIRGIMISLVSFYIAFIPTMILSLKE